MVKYTPAVEGKEEYERVHTSFQSTSSCNISSVNAPNECVLWIKKKERGVGKSKRLWGIEMNSARNLYLKTYYRIDCMDHMIKNARLFYRSWKYWHSLMLHGKEMAVVVAYDMYLEVAEGKLRGEWKLDEPMDFWRFRERLANGMLKYKPMARKYPGDEKMRSSTQQSQRQRDAAKKTRGPGRPRKNNETTTNEIAMTDDSVTVGDLKKAARGNTSRICGDLSLLKKHIKSVVSGRKHGKTCVVCGEMAYSICKMCDRAMHFFPQKGKCTGKDCFVDYHNEVFFGLALDDASLVNKRRSEWTPHNITKRINNERHIKSLRTQQEDDG